jgi:hypothetical protein
MLGIYRTITISQVYILVISVFHKQKYQPVQELGLCMNMVLVLSHHELGVCAAHLATYFEEKLAGFHMYDNIFLNLQILEFNYTTTTT